jgi:hypothetical protein
MHDFSYIDDKAGMGKLEGDFFSQPVLPPKSAYARLTLTELLWLIKPDRQLRPLARPPKGNGVAAAAGG